MNENRDNLTTKPDRKQRGGWLFGPAFLFDFISSKLRKIMNHNCSNYETNKKYCDADGDYPYWLLIPVIVGAALWLLL